MDDKKVKITIICFVAGYALNKETYTYNKCYKLLKMEVGVLEGVLKK